MAKSISRDEAFNIAGTHTQNENAQEITQSSEDNEEQISGETKVRKTQTTKKKQADNSQTRAVTCYMPKDLYKRLRIETLERDCSMTSYIIWAVEEYMRNHKD